MKLPTAHPASNFAEAAARIQALQAQDDISIHPLSQTKLWTHGDKTGRAVLYLHGYTDSNQQFAQLGELLFQHGANVFAPRMPYHGYRDRMARDHGNFTAAEMVAWASSAVDMALGLGDQLTVIGLSLGGVLTTWVAEQRAEVDRAVIVSAAYGANVIPPRLTPTAARVVRRLPNRFLWWDGQARAETGCEYAYPQFATHTLAEAFLLSHTMLKQARERAPAARSVWMVTNANDKAVNNELCGAFVAAWRKHSATQVHTFQFPGALGLPHDLLDSTEIKARPALVYPTLDEIVRQGTSSSSL